MPTLTVGGTVAAFSFCIFIHPLAVSSGPKKTAVTTFVFLKSWKIEGMDNYGQQNSDCR
jgi:hypothetical protein